MRFLILFLFLAAQGWGATYYVDCAADGDAGAGTSTAANVAWKTIAKVNASTFAPGDNVLFNRGCTWREKLTVPSSGSDGSPITFSAYGSGASPILDGSVDIKGVEGDWSIVPTWTGGDTQSTATATRATGQTYYTQILTTNGGQLQSISIQIAGAPAGISAKMCLYSHAETAGGNPGSPIPNTETETKTLTADSVMTFSVADGANLSPNTLYWIAMMATGTGTQYYGGAGYSPASGTRLKTAAHAVTWPNWNAVGPGWAASDNSAGRAYVTTNISNVWTSNIGSFVFPYKTPNLWIDGRYGTWLGNGAPSAPGEYRYVNPNIYIYSTSNPASAFSELLRSNLQNGIVVPAKDYVTIEGMGLRHFNHIEWSATWDQSDGAILFDGSDHGIVRDCDIARVSKGISFAKASSYPTAQGNTITNVYHWVNFPNGTGIFFNDDHAMIDGNVINMLSSSYASESIRTGDGIAARTYAGLTASYFPSDAVISNNTISNTGGFGIFFINYAADAGLDGTPLNWQIYGNSISATRTTFFDANHDADCIGMGSTESSISLPNFLIHGNTVSECFNAGINVANSIGAGGIIYNNIVKRSGLGVGTQGGIRCNNGCNIYNNTIYDTLYGAAIAAGTKIPAPDTPKNMVRNNLIHTVSNSGYGIFCDNGDGTGDGSQTEGSNNLIYGTEAGKETKLFTNTNGVADNPDFVSTSDFHLLPSSPAINAGVDVGLTTDIEGKAIRGLPDIGAYEFQKTGGVSKAFLLRSGRHR